MQANSKIITVPKKKFIELLQKKIKENTVLASTKNTGRELIWILEQNKGLQQAIELAEKHLSN